MKSTSEIITNSPHWQRIYMSFQNNLLPRFKLPNYGVISAAINPKLDQVPIRLDVVKEISKALKHLTKCEKYNPNCSTALLKVELRKLFANNSTIRNHGYIMEGEIAYCLHKMGFIAKPLRRTKSHVAFDFSFSSFKSMIKEHGSN